MPRLMVFMVVLELINYSVATECIDKMYSKNCTSLTVHKESSNISQSQEIHTGHTSKLAVIPKLLNTLTENRVKSVFRPTVLPLLNNTFSLINTKHVINQQKDRALNFTMNGQGINTLSLNSTRTKFPDLSDVSIDENDDADGHEMLDEKNLESKLIEVNGTLETCVEGGLTYENGEQLENGCDSICTCKNGKMDCIDRCSDPFLRKGKKFDDPLCILKETEDPCCVILACTADSEMEPSELCSYDNKTYNKGDSFNKGCQEVCSCETNGKITCKARCNVVNKTWEKCVEIQDPNDLCCKKILCDVTVEDHEQEKEKNTTRHKIISAKFLNATTIQLIFDSSILNLTYSIIKVSDDKKLWQTYKIINNEYVVTKSTAKYLRLENSDEVIKIQNESRTNSMVVSDGCLYKGIKFKLTEEYNDNCISLCVCQSTGMKCLKLDCPTYFGVDVIDPNCIEWDTVPSNFVPSPPNCCPEKLKCKNNGSCLYKGQIYQNWQQLPLNVTGCEKRCYCEMGNVECQNACPPVTALPPSTLHCPPHQAIVDHLADDECCMYWVCNPHTQTTDEQLDPTNYPGIQHYQDEVSVHILEAIDAHTVRLAFIIPAIIVGLHGRVEVRYTNKDNPDINKWELQVFAPPNDLIVTPQLEFDLLGLKPDTEYKIKITITLRDLHNTPSSRIYKIKTLKDINLTTLPPMIPIEPELSINHINSTWVSVIWRKFTENELQFIDGVQLRYKEIDGKIYDATPLIHRSVTSYNLENLKPNTKYEIGIFFIPFHGQVTELHSENMVRFATTNKIDIYGFNISLEINHIKSTSVEIAWSGVPYPEDKYVNIYRAIYQNDMGKEHHSTFKIAKRDSPTKTTVMDLKPGTRYRLWLEVYLTNGKIKTSNVQDFITKPWAAPSLGKSAQQNKLSVEEYKENKGDYYGPLVIVAILASIAIMSTLILLLILIRRHNQNKAAITPPQRVSQSAYDNPTYKVEIQQETMGL